MEPGELGGGGLEFVVVIFFIFIHFIAHLLIINYGVPKGLVCENPISMEMLSEKNVK